MTEKEKIEETSSYFYRPVDFFKHKPFLNRILNHFVKMLIKISEMVVSVKVLSLVGFSALNTWLVINNYIEGAHFATIQVSLITVVLGMREIYKIGRLVETHQKDIEKASEKMIEKLTNSGVIKNTFK